MESSGFGQGDVGAWFYPTGHGWRAILVDTDGPTLWRGENPPENSADFSIDPIPEVVRETQVNWPAGLFPDFVDTLKLEGIGGFVCRSIEVARSYRTKEQGGIHHSPRQWADVIERFRKGDDTLSADPAEMRFETYNPAKTRRDSDGTAGVGADAAVAEAGSNGGSRAAARASRDSREVPGIADGTEVRVAARDAVGEFVHVGLAEDDGACNFEFSDDRGIFLGYEIPQDF